MDCGCKIDLNFIDKLQGQGLEFSITYCPMHEAAPTLVAALEAITEKMEIEQTFFQKGLSSTEHRNNLIINAQQALSQVKEE